MEATRPDRFASNSMRRGTPELRGRLPRGFTLLETLASLLLLALLLQGGWQLLARFRSATESLALEAEGVETIRTLSWVLSEEVTARERGWSWWWSGGDSLELRVFRGTGLVEGRPVEPDGLTLCFRGIRAPEPDKDSVLVLGGDGLWSAHRMVSRRILDDSCGGAWRDPGEGAHIESWVLAPSPPEDGIVARLFERGSYHLADRALRYRRGLGGRQPLTPERILVGELGPAPGEETVLRWEALLSMPPGDTATRPWSGRIR